MASRAFIDSTGVRAGAADGAPDWCLRSPLLTDAYTLAVVAHGEQRRPSDGLLFIGHVVEVATFLHDAGFGEELVAVGLLHDAVERGTLQAPDLRRQMGASICALVLTLSEDSRIDSFDWRKADLRRQVESAGGLAVTVYAADKLSDIRGLRRGLVLYGPTLDERLGTSVGKMASHYRESVGMIESVRPGSVFLPDLRQDLRDLEHELRSR